MSKKSVIIIAVIVLAIVVIGAAVLLLPKESDDTYTLSFNTNGGTKMSSITQAGDTTLAIPAEPVLDGSVFLGWYSDENLTAPFESNKMPSKNMTLYAKWAQIQGYSIEDINKILNDPSTTSLYFESNTTSSSIALYQNELEMLEHSNVKTIDLVTSNGRVSIDLSDLLDLESRSPNPVIILSFSDLDKTALAKETLEAIGDRPVYELIVKISELSDDEDDDYISISIPYSLLTGEDRSKIGIFSMGDSLSYNYLSENYSWYSNGTINSLTYYGVNYLVIAHDGLSWPDMYGIGIPKASEKIDSFAYMHSLYDLLKPIVSDLGSDKILKYVNFSSLEYAVQGVQLENYNQNNYELYINSLKSDGFNAYFSSNDDSSKLWIGVKSIGNVDYLVIVELQDVFDASLSVTVLNVDPLKLLGIEITKAESDVWYDSLGGILTPEVYAGAKADMWLDLKLDGTALSDFLSSFINKNELSQDERKVLDACINIIGKSNGDVGVASITASESDGLTKRTIDQLIQNMANENELKIIYMGDENDGLAILANVCKYVDGKYEFDKAAIITWSDSDFDDYLDTDSYTLSIVAVNMPMNITIDEGLFPGIDFSSEFFVAWDQQISNLYYPAPFEDSIIDFYASITVSQDSIEKIYEIALASDSSDIKNLLKALSSLENGVSICAVSTSSPQLTVDVASAWVEAFASENNLNIAMDTPGMWLLSKGMPHSSDYADAIIIWSESEYMGSTMGCMSIISSNFITYLR